MNTLKKEQQLLEDELKRIMKGMHSREITGRNFTFASQHGSHFEILMGIIKGVGYSDEGGFKLYVSCPKFWGVKLDSITWDSTKEKPIFYARIQDGKKTFKNIRGNLQML